jgi:hypothetical protein
MTRLLFHSQVDELFAAPDLDVIQVLLYGTSPSLPGTGSLGNQLRKACESLPCAIPQGAFDFLTIALAVTAADTFVRRQGAPDRWSRSLHLDVPLADPAPWQASRQDLQAALRFLTGDDWQIDFRPGGLRAPARDTGRRRRYAIDLGGVDCASLFSGGLDSALGVTSLIDRGRWPLLVSHAYTKDRAYQKAVSRRIAKRAGRQPPMFLANAHPTWLGLNDDSMRSRSFNFLAYGAVAAAAVATVRGIRSATLFVPENGTIAVNAPLTLRRIGSHSTRTTHPHFLASMQGIFDRVGIPVRIENEFRHSTKGEMLSAFSEDTETRDMAVGTVSCGKWKRRSKQCGRCLPCLIRRAAFHGAGVEDATEYRFNDLAAVLREGTGRDKDDLLSVMAALRRPRARFATWVAQSGPLPDNPAERDGYVDVFRRGLDELGAFLVHDGVA